jgi:chromosome segregation ATPase
MRGRRRSRSRTIAPSNVGSPNSFEPYRSRFFCWDVRKARDSIHAAQNRISAGDSKASKILSELQNTRSDVIRLKDDTVRQLGQMRDDAESQLKEIRDQALAHMKDVREEVDQLGSKVQELSDQTGTRTSGTTQGRSDIQAIRQVIGSSKFEWTTIERIAKHTGLPYDVILKEARADEGLVIGWGKKTQQNILKFKSS